MIRLFTIIVLVTSSILVLGDREEILNSIRATYRNHDEIKNLYLKLNSSETFKSGKMNPCALHQPYFFEQGSTRKSELNIKSEVITGDMGDEQGFYLILDDFSIIDIPAMIECTPKLKNGSNIQQGRKMFMYYLVLHGNENNYNYEMVYASDTLRNLKRVFLTTKARVIDYVSEAHNSTNKRVLSKWLKSSKAEKQSKELCTAMIKAGVMNTENSNHMYNVIKAEFVARTNILRITETTQINMRGFLKCILNVTAPTDLPDKIYFTVVKLEVETEDHSYVRIFGPKTIANKTTFALSPKLFKQIV